MYVYFYLFARAGIARLDSAYLEAAEVAYPRKADVDAAYARLIEATLDVNSRELCVFLPRILGQLCFFSSQICAFGIGL